VAQEVQKVDVDPLVHPECLDLRVKRVELVLMVLLVHQARQVQLDLPAIEVHQDCPVQLVQLVQEELKVLRVSEVILVKLEKKVLQVLQVCQDPTDLLDLEVNGVKKDLLESLGLLELVVVLETRVPRELLVLWDLQVDQDYPVLLVKLDPLDLLVNVENEAKVDLQVLLVLLVCLVSLDPQVCKAHLAKKERTEQRVQKDIAV